MSIATSAVDLRPAVPAQAVPVAGHPRTSVSAGLENGLENGIDAEAHMHQIHRDNGTALLLFLRSLVSPGAAPTAEDLVQETMLRAWRSLEAVPTESESQRRWLFTVARRLAIDAYRKRQSRPVEVSLIDTEPIGSAGETAETVIAKLTLRRAVSELSPDHRSVLLELYVKGHSLDEASLRLGVPIGTIKSRAHYAVQSLRQALTG